MKESNLLLNIVLILNNSESFPVRIQNALTAIGTHEAVSGIYIFTDKPIDKESNRLYEWNNTKTTSSDLLMPDILHNNFSVLKEMLTSSGKISPKNIKELPVPLQNILKPKDGTSVLIYPLYMHNVIAGFIKFDTCGTKHIASPGEPDLLKNISGMIAAAYERESDHKELEATKNNFETFFDTIDDLILIGDTQGKILYANKAVIRKLEYSMEELFSMNILELHPENKREEATRIITAMFAKELDYCPLEVESKSHIKIPVETRVWLGRWNNQDCIFGISKDLTKEQEALQKFTRLFNNNPALMAISTLPERIFTDINESFLEKLGYSRNEVVGKTASELGLFVLEENQNKIAEKLRNSGSIKNEEFQIKCKNGKILTGLFSGEIIETQGKRYFLTVMVDITESVLLREKSKAQQKRINNVIEGTRLGTWEWNIQTGETIFNDRWAEMLGYTLEELAPVSIKTWERLAHPDDLEKSNALVLKHLNNETAFYDFEGRMKHKNGNWVWIWDRGKVIEWDDDGNPLKMFGTHSDITEKKEMEEKIKEISIRDPLTNIYNRRYIFERLDAITSEYTRTNNPFAISIIDLDHFKRINDTHGHQAGDFILTEFTKVIKDNIRPYDLLGRYGGEEFIIISINADKEQARATIERILNIIRKLTFIYKEIPIKLTFTCGISDISEFDKENIAISNLIERSDTRLYKGKKTGRNKIVFSDF